MMLVDSFKISKKIKTEQEKLSMELPFIFALFGCLISSGATLYDSIGLMSLKSPPITKKFFSRLLFDLQSGLLFTYAIEDMYKQNLLRPLARIMSEMYESGISGTESIDRLHKDSLSNVSRKANMEVKKLTVKLLFPLVFCILPAFVFLSILPVLLSGLMDINI